MKQQTRNWLLAALILITLINLGAIFLIPEHNLHVILTSLAIIILNSLTTYLLGLAAIQEKKRSNEQWRGWFFLCLAQLAFTLGDVIWMVYESILQLEPFPSAADIFYLLYYPFFLGGIFHFRRQKQSKFKQVSSWLDVSIVFIAASLFSGVYIFAPLLTSLIGEDMLSRIISIAYPLGDLVLLSALLVLFYFHSSKLPRLPMQFLVISIAIQIASDIIFSFQSQSGSYISGGWLDGGWILGYLFTGLAAYHQTHMQQEKNGSQIPFERKRFLPENAARLLNNAIPAFIVLFAYLLLFSIYRRAGGFFSNLLFIGFGALLILVLVRQFLTLWENFVLNKELRDTLNQLDGQSQALQKINEDLRYEISQRRKAESQLAFDALHDSLTKLPNRALFLDRLRHAIDYGRRHKEYGFSVFFIDIDHFKNVNDSMGHPVGDKLLLAFSARVQKCLRQSDTLARLGGDEFAILLENSTEKESALRIAQRILESLRVPYQLAGTDFYISASIGIVLNTQEYQQADDALRDADIAMYRAKALGKARYEIFSPDLRDEAASKLALDSQLRGAMERGEMRLDYQPIYSLKSRELVGFEALLRWQHPERGLLPPAEFLTFAEESGMIIPLGEWVLQQACRQMSRWRKTHAESDGLVVNVNISSRQFQQLDFVDLIEATLNENALPPSALHLEITESVLINNMEQAGQVLKELHKMGVQIQIDDFGSGYSSLGYLQQFPVDTIKIDKSFVQAMQAGSKSSQLVKTMVAMARNLGMSIIAEGIETDQQLVELCAMECGFGQGFYLSHPLPANEIESLISEQPKP